jgi:hypothetical protein
MCLFIFDLKYIMGKSIFFIVLIGFMGLFVSLFGTENSMVGVMILVTLLMMLEQDLSKKPVSSLLGMIVLNVSIILVCFLTSLSAWLGVFLVFLLIFFIIYFMMHDLKTPLYFPFVLGYMLIMSTPVSFSGLPLRVLSVIVGSIFIVLVNILVNRRKLEKTVESSIEALLTETSKCISLKIKGESPLEDDLIESNKNIKSAIYDRLDHNYYSTPFHKSVMNLSISIEHIGLSVCRDDYDNKDLSDLNTLIETIINYEVDEDEDGGKSSICELTREVDIFIKSHESLGYGILSNLKIICYELEYLYDNHESVEKSKSGIPRNFRIKTIFWENLNMDSVKFTFAFRLAIIVAIWEFIGVYFNLPDARWLACTSLAIILPYRENVLSKSKNRIIGTVLGLIIFSILALLFLGQFNLFNLLLNINLSAQTTGIILVMLISYIYTLVKPERYDIDTLFITLQAVLYSFTMYSANLSMILRFLFVALGIIVAIPANYLIMPYTLLKEDLNMCNRQMKLTKEQILNFKDALKGNWDDEKNTVIILKSSLISDKIEVNNQIDNNKDVSLILENQNEIIEQCTFLKNLLKVNDYSVNLKNNAVCLIEDYDFNCLNVEDYTDDELIFLRIIKSMMDNFKFTCGKLDQISE